MTLTQHVVFEDDLSIADRCALGNLLSDGFGDRAYLKEGYRTLRPFFRTILLLGDSVLGQQSVFRLETDPSLNAFGFGDLVIEKTVRGKRYGASLVARALTEAALHQPDLMVTATTHPAVIPAFRRSGFLPVQPHQVFFREKDDTPAKNPDWWVRFDRGEPREVRLLQPDF